MWPSDLTLEIQSLQVIRMYDEVFIITHVTKTNLFSVMELLSSHKRMNTWQRIRVWEITTQVRLRGLHSYQNRDWAQSLAYLGTLMASILCVSLPLSPAASFATLLAFVLTCTYT